MVDKMCALCADLQNANNILNVSDSVSDECRLDSLISKHLHIKIRSNYICLNCFTKLGKFDIFYKRVHELQKKISFLLETRLISNSDKVEDVQNSSTTHSIGFGKEEPIPIEIFNVTDQVIRIDSEQTKKIDSSISFVKEEPIEIFDVTDQVIRIDSEQTKNIDSKEIDYYEHENMKKVNWDIDNIIEDYYKNESKDDLDHNQEEKICQIVSTFDQDKEKNKDLINVEGVKQDTESRVSSVALDNFNNIDYDTDNIDHDDKIHRFLDLVCTICKEKFPTLHYHNIHQTRGCISCCDLKFYAREELVDHIECNHLNILKCHGHIKKEKLNRIDLEKIVHSSEDTIIKCKQCNKKFKTNFALKIHQGKFHRMENRNFPCNICCKPFKRKELLLENFIMEGRIEGNDWNNTNKRKRDNEEDEISESDKTVAKIDKKKHQNELARLRMRRYRENNNKKPEDLSSIEHKRELSRKSSQKYRESKPDIKKSQREYTQRHRDKKRDENLNKAENLSSTFNYNVIDLPITDSPGENAFAFASKPVRNIHNSQIADTSTLHVLHVSEDDTNHTEIQDSSSVKVPDI